MRRAILLLLSCAVLAMAIASPAQTFTTMYDFQGLNDSGYPWASLVQGVDGSYYGEAQGISQNNDLGAIFKITSSGSFTTVLHFESAIRKALQVPSEAWCEPRMAAFTGSVKAGGLTSRGRSSESGQTTWLPPSTTSAHWGRTARMAQPLSPRRYKVLMGTSMAQPRAVA